jgi:hypothetical protein
VHRYCLRLWCRTSWFGDHTGSVVLLLCSAAPRGVHSLPYMFAVPPQAMWEASHAFESVQALAWLVYRLRALHAAVPRTSWSLQCTHVGRCSKQCSASSCYHSCLHVTWHGARH